MSPEWNELSSVFHALGGKTNPATREHIRL
jgi:hypothetical protein